MERRISERMPTHIPLTCRVPATPQSAVVHDISREGCRLEFLDFVIDRGATLSLELADGTRLRGEAVWAHYRTAGVRFSGAMRASTAVFVGLDSPEPEPEPEPEPAAPDGGLLRHWFRRLTRAFG